MSKREYNYWIPLSDLMTVLMVMFMFMAISYMVVVKKKHDRNDKVIQDYRNTKKELLSDIKTQFATDFTNNNMVLDTNDLSIKFIDRKILFDFNKSELKEEFQDMLDDFLPRYLTIILQQKYADKISEVRIEGHTSNEGDYLYNVQLSQDRTRNVMGYLFDLDYYKALHNAEKNRLCHWLTANGLSYGRMVDKDGKPTYETNATADATLCRRVEFKIVIKTDDSLKHALNNFNKSI